MIFRKNFRWDSVCCVFLSTCEFLLKIHENKLVVKPASDHQYDGTKSTFAEFIAENSRSMCCKML